MKLFRHFKLHIQNHKHIHVHWILTLSLYQNKLEVNNISLNYQPHSNSKKYQMLLTSSHSHWHIYHIHRHTYKFPLSVALWICKVPTSKPLFKPRHEFHWQFLRKFRILFLILLYRDTLQGIKKQRNRRYGSGQPGNSLCQTAAFLFNLFPPTIRILLFFL